MGSVQRARHARRRLHAVRRGRCRRSATRWPSCSPTTTTRCWRPTSTTRRAVPYRRLRAELAAQTRRALRAPGVLRLGDHRRRRRRADRRASPSSCPPPRATATARVSGTVFKVERGHGRARRSPTSGCSRERCAVRERLRFGGGRRAEGHGDRACSTAARPSSAPSVAAGQIGKLWGLGDDPDRRRDRRVAHGRGRAPLRAADARDRRRSAPRPPTRRRSASRSPSSPSRTR